MSTMRETEKDEIKSCLFHEFLNRNGTYVQFSGQRLSKIKDSSAKRQDELQLNLEPVQSKRYSHNGCYLHYTSF